ncbi:uncharacterized protein BDCG_17176 [Blastomyces dermatitidis ER-3]|uniref:Uncharacterized protein n=1 Tax=Ajellomyces dermatitidis (strain ER-3 / ATCC MYA-2586) TaxID=559297 RepID=A0ABX2VWV3_AJEDR|nr:uncharacterized protein BDCG_17176 [Blastomyces dermatitidis ER-3]OAT01626.1 hypothetical protein BDCG_17176 [Blastomyces dermatitidis ER-3]
MKITITPRHKEPDTEFYHSQRVSAGLQLRSKQPPATSASTQPLACQLPMAQLSSRIRLDHHALTVTIE